MNRKLLSRLGITAVTLLLVGTGLVFAAISIPPTGTICVKPAKMTHTFKPPGTGNGIFATTSGQITAQVGQPIPSGFAFKVIDFKSTGSVTGLGNVSLTLDTTRTPQTSTFIANPSGQDSTQRINFFLNATVNGRTYRSAGQVTLLSTSVTAFPPPPGTSYSLTTTVQLVDSAGTVAFTLPVGQAATIL